jgi:hypothetical protein
MKVQSIKLVFIAINLDRNALNSNEGKPIRHFVSKPGVCFTLDKSALVGGIYS